MWRGLRPAFIAAVLLPATLLAGCAAFDPPAPAPLKLTGVLTGTASYRERIALLPGAVLRVTLEDATQGDAAVATSATLIERQVPIPFTLAYDPERIAQDHRYAVRAQIESANGQRLWSTTERYPVITQGHPDHVEVMLHPSRAPAEIRAQGDEDALLGRTYTYQCEGMAFTVRNGPAMMALYLPDGYRVLPQVRAASGARYQEGDTQFWSKGSEATLEAGGKRYAGCKLDAARTAQEDAKLRSVSLRAQGSEPAWTLDIEKGRWLRFIGEGGGASAYLPAQNSSIEGDKTLYRATSAEHRMEVVVERSSCRDPRSDKSSDARVTVRMDGREYRGCGMALE